MVISILFLSLLAYVSKAESDIIIPAVLGSSVTLECKIQQTGTLFWDHQNGTIIAMKGSLFRGADPAKYFIQISNTTISQSLVIHGLTLSDDGEYRCFDVANTGIKQTFRVNILVRPTYFKAVGPTGTIEEGTQHTLTCEADGGKPPPNIEWYLIGPNTNRTKLIGYNSDQQYSNGTWFRKSSLFLKVSREMYQASLICIATISYFYEVQQTAVLDVNLYPLNPSFTSFTGLFDDRTTQSIECHSDGSKPAAHIYWILNGVRMNSTATTVSKNNNGTFYISATLTKTLTKAMEGQVLVCAVENNVLKNQNKPAITSSVTLLPNYSPTIIADNGTRTLTEGNDIILSCDIDARPLPNIADVNWFHDNSPATGDRFNTTVQTHSISKLSVDLSISSISKKEIGHYQCVAKNHLGSIRSQPLVLDVLYRPVCSFAVVQKHAAGIGQSVSLTCRFTANPKNVSVNWKYTNRNIPMTNTQPVIKAPNGSLYTMITIDMASAMQYTEVACFASNAVGEMMVPCLYRIVKPGPPEVPRNCSATTVSDSVVRIQCTPGFNGGSQQQFVLQQYVDTKFIDIKNESISVIEVHDLEAGSNYTYRMCAVTATYSSSISCSQPVVATTPNHVETSVDSRMVQPTASANTTPYIVGSVCGFIALLCIIVIIVYFVRKKKQVGKEATNVKIMSELNQKGKPCMPTLTDCFTHAQFQSVVDFPKHVQTDASDKPRSSSNRNTGTWSGNGWISDGGSTDIRITPGIRNSVFEVENDATTRKMSNKEFEVVKSSSNSHFVNSFSETDRQDSNIKTSHADDRLTFTVYRNEHNNLSDECISTDKSHGINLAFEDDEVTDLDALSNQGSPMPKATGSPRHEFCYSETDILAAVRDEKETGIESDTVSIKRSRSHESVKRQTSVEDIRGDYINLAYNVKDASGENEEMENINIRESPSGSFMNYSMADEQLKRSFVSQYTIQLEFESRPTDSKSSSNDATSADNNDRPRRNSYNMAISSDDGEDNDNKLRNEILTPVELYDHPKCLVTDIDLPDNDDRHLHNSERSSVSSSDVSIEEAKNMALEGNTEKMDSGCTDGNHGGSVTLDELLNTRVLLQSDGEKNGVGQNRLEITARVDSDTNVNDENTNGGLFVAYF